MNKVTKTENQCGLMLRNPFKFTYFIANKYIHICVCSVNLLHGKYTQGLMDFGMPTSDVS